MKKYLAMMLIALMSVSMFSGCAQNAGPSASAPSAQAPASASDQNQAAGAKETKVVMALEQDIEEFDPTMNVYNISSTILQNLFRGLYKLDSNNTPVPAYAASHEMDDTGTKYTFKLREGAKWSDGTPLTANDFEYSWKRVADPEVASKAASEIFMLKNAQAFFEGTATADQVGVKAVDDLTLEVELEGPTPYFLSSLCTTTFYPVKKELVEAGGEWKKNADTYVSTGPFLMKEMRPGEKYIMEKNPHYIDADKVQLDILEMVIIESPEAELAAYMNDEIDVSNNVSSESLKKYTDTDDLKIVDRIGVIYYDINTSRAPYDDVRVRKALGMVMDRELLINNITQTPHKPAYGVVPYIIPDLNDPSKEYRNTVGPLFEENIEEAKKLLAEAGFPNGEGFPVIDFIVTPAQPYKDLAQAIQSMWKEHLGIDSEITIYESKVYWGEQDAGNFDVMYDAWTGDFLDPMTMMALFDETRQSYQTRWVNKEYTRLLAENRTTGDQKKRMENFVKAEKILMDEMPVIPLYFRVNPFLCKPNIEGVFKNYIGHVYFEYVTVN